MVEKRQEYKIIAGKIYQRDHLRQEDHIKVQIFSTQDTVCETDYTDLEKDGAVRCCEQGCERSSFVEIEYLQ